MSTQNEDYNHNYKTPKVVYIRDFPFPASKFFDPKKIEESLNYSPKDNDIILCSYPKTGSTLLQYIIWQILHKGESYPKYEEMISKCVPFMEMTGADALESLSSPRFYRNHIPYHLLKINEKAKYIYVHRNPADTLVSYYHFSMATNACSFNFNDFFESFLEDGLPFGAYFDHVMQFHYHKNDAHLLLISYEDLQKDKKQQILRLAKFLGEEYHQTLVENDAFLQNILENTSFDYMKKQLGTSAHLKEGSLVKKRNSAMFRKGVVGDGKNILSSEQMEKLNQKMKEKMKGTDFIQSWVLQ